MTTSTRPVGLHTPQKVMVGGFAVIAALVWIVEQVFADPGFDPVAVGIGAVALAAAGLVATGRRWALITATVVAVLLFLFDLPVLIQGIAEPGNNMEFAMYVVAAGCYLAVLGGAAVALVRLRR